MSLYIGGLQSGLSEIMKKGLQPALRKLTQALLFPFDSKTWTKLKERVGIKGYKNKSVAS